MTIRKSLSSERHKKSICLLVSFLLLMMSIPLTSCAQANSEEEVPSLSTYREKRIDLPYAVELIMSLEKLENGKIWLLGASSDMSTISLWELSDDDSWKNVSLINDWLPSGPNDIFITAPITKSGKLLFIFSNILDMQERHRFFLFDLELETDYRELNISIPDAANSQETLRPHVTPLSVFPLRDGTFLIQNGSGSLFLLNSENETIVPVPSGGNDDLPNIQSVAELDGKLYVFYEDLSGGQHSLRLSLLELSTGSISSLNNMLHEEIFSLFAEHNKYSFFNVIQSMEGSTSQADRITFCFSNGIFELSNNKIRKIAEAEGTILSDPTLLVGGCVFDEGDDFFLLCWKLIGSEFLSLLYKYERTDSSFVSSNTLRVFSLYDSAEVRQAVALFKSEHPEVAVVLEIGLSTRGITIEDALRNLNTEILSGTGPDLLFLDGLPIEAFLEQGVLHDLTDIYNEAFSSGLYYENILGSFMRDGECRIIPMRFTFPLIIADQKTIDRIDNLPSLVDVARELIDRSPDSPLFCGISIIDNLFIASYPDFFYQGELDKVALTKFFDCIKNLTVLLESNNNQRSVYPNLRVPGAQEAHGLSDLSGPGLRSFYYNPDQIFICRFLTEISFGLGEAYWRNIGTAEILEVFALGQRRCFLPRIKIAINNSCKENELAESFVLMMLGKNYQSNAQNEGLSITKDAIQINSMTPFGIGFEDGTMLSIKPFSNETIAAYQALFYSLNTPVAADSVIQKTIYEQLTKYLAGEMTLEDAVDACAKRINLYLAE